MLIVATLSRLIDNLALFLIGCGGYFTAVDTPRYISSPNYPQNYPLSVTCTWVFTATNGHAIKLNFTDFALEYGFGVCSADYVELRDGATSAASSLGRYCGLRSSFAVHTHGSSLYVKFVSDSSIVRRGFRAKYERGMFLDSHYKSFISACIF